MDKLKFLSKYKQGNLRNRQLNQQLDIIRYLSKSETGRSIPEIAKHIKSSVPTITKLVKELFDHKYIIEEGKRETDNGRRPTLYAVNLEKFYVVGVEILSKFIHVSIVRIDFKTAHKTFNRQFRLEDTNECLHYIRDYIYNAIQESGIINEQIIGVGIGMTGDVNGHTGVPSHFFTNKAFSFKTFLEQKLQLLVRVDNDTRSIGIAEQILGQAKGIDNVLVIKVSRNLGLSIILNKTIIMGSMGFAGNFEHTQFLDNNRLCSCGKMGCLGTVVSGEALQNDLIEALNDNKQSLHFKKENKTDYEYHDVLDAVLKGDALAIELLQQQGDKLGQALGNLVNLFNPSLILIGGEFVMVEDFFIDTIKMGIKKTALIDTMLNCKVKPSNLGRYLSSKASACMLLKTCDLVEY